jgi:hypothetical protein
MGNILRLSQKYDESLTRVNYYKFMLSFGPPLSSPTSSILCRHDSPWGRPVMLCSEIIILIIWLPLFPAKTSLPCKHWSVQRIWRIHLNEVLCSKDSRTLFVLKQVTSLLQPHISALTGQPAESECSRTVDDLGKFPAVVLLPAFLWFLFMLCFYSLVRLFYSLGPCIYQAGFLSLSYIPTYFVFKMSVCLIHFTFSLCSRVIYTASVGQSRSRTVIFSSFTQPGSTKGRMRMGQTRIGHRLLFFSPWACSRGGGWPRPWKNLWGFRKTPEKRRLWEESI